MAKMAFSLEEAPCRSTGFFTGVTVITVNVRTILTIKKILGKGEFDVSVPEGSSLDDLLSYMIRTWGDQLSSYLLSLNSKGDAVPTRLVRIMINGRDIEFLHGLETVLHEGDEVLILPIVSGG